MAERKICYSSYFLSREITEFEKQGLTKKEAVVDTVEEKEWSEADGFLGPAPFGISEFINVDYIIHIECADEKRYYEVRYGEKDKSLEGLMGDIGIEGSGDLITQIKKLKGRKVLAYFSEDKLVGLSAPEE